MAAPIYPVETALAEAAAAGVTAERLFRVLWPLWEVEVTADALVERRYGLVDRFVVRVVLDGGLSEVDEIADFLGLSPELVIRCLRSLRRLGHVEPGGDAEPAVLSDLGRRAAADGVRYEPTRTRHLILLDAVTGGPLPAHFGQEAVVRLPSPDRPSGGPVFHSLFAAGPFDTALVAELTGRPDLGLPAGARSLRVEQVRRSHLPAYVVQTATDDLLVYTAAATAPDPLLGAAAHALPGLRAAIASWVAERTTDVLVPPEGRP